MSFDGEDQTRTGDSGLREEDWGNGAWQLLGQRRLGHGGNMVLRRKKRGWPCYYSLEVVVLYRTRTPRAAMVFALHACGGGSWLAGRLGEWRGRAGAKAWPTKARIRRCVG